jgi:ABC-type molybdate transport system substrate-binding protein
MSYRRYLSSVVFVVALMLSICTNAQSQSEITLLAPRPMQPTIDKIVAKFQSTTSHTVTVAYQPAKLIRQLVAKGQPLDVSLIAAPFPGAIASGTIVTGSATPVVGFLTAVAVPKGASKPDISTPAAVKKALLAAESIGYEDPEFAIDGEAPSEAINNLGIAAQIAMKIKVCAGAANPYGPNSVCFDPSGAAGPRRATLTQDCAPNSNCFTAPPAGTGGSVFSIQKQLAQGKVGLAMLFLSDMIPNKDKYDIVGVLPRKICPPTPVVGFISTHANDAEAAKALLQYLASPEVQAMFKADGYEPHS